MQHIDKIAMIAAVVIVLGGIIYASTGKDEGGASEARISTAEQEIREHESAQEDTVLVADKWQDQLGDRFSPRPATGKSEWMFYRRPAQLTVSPEVILVAPVHLAPRLTRVDVMPDMEREAFVYKVTAELGDSENIKNQTLTIEVREGVDGEWVEFGQVSSDDLAGGHDVYDPKIIEAGKQYSFRIRSEADSNTAKPIPDGEQSLHSQESEPRFLPPTEDWHCSSCRPFDAIAGTPGDAVIFRARYNFKTNKVEVVNDRFSEPDKISNPTKFWDSNWGLQIIKRDEDQRRMAPLVINKTLPRRAKRKRFLDVRSKHIDFAVGAWVAQEPVEGEESAAKKPEVAKPVEKESGSGSLFGGDEDD